MRKLYAILVSAGLILGLAGLAMAKEKAAPVTLDGQMECAKCTLKVEGVKECQDVLVVKNGEKEEHYYVMKNDVAKTFGHTCSGTKDVKVTGTVADKDGKKWIDATSIEPKS